jgi:selenocysteine lyase/cysteine desulfurase
VFISPHKFVGGPGTPGVLVVRRELLTNSVPDVVGGGTVAYVNPTEHRYLDDPVHREEGGTPAIVESIRAGWCSS